MKIKRRTKFAIIVSSTLIVTVLLTLTIVRINRSLNKNDVWLELNITGIDTADTAWVTPSKALSRSEGSWTFSYIPGKSFSDRGEIILLIPAGFMASTKSWTQPQSTNSEFPGYVTVRSNNKSTKIKTTIFRDSYDYRVRSIFTEFPPQIGDTIRIVYGDSSISSSGRALSHVHAADYRFPLLVDRHNKREYSEAAPTPTVRIKARPAKQFLITVPSIIKESEEAKVIIVALDEYNNVDKKFSGKLTLSCDKAQECGVPDLLFFNISDSGRKEIHISPKEGVHQIFASTGDRIRAKSNPFLVRSENPKYRLQWGDLHNHSDLSDGTGSLEDFYRYARFAANLDFISLTDHDHVFKTFYLRKAVWNDIKSAAKRYNVEGEFVTFLGWEWTQEEGGHRHVIYPNNDGKPIPFTDYPTPPDLWKALEGTGALAIPHHVAWGSRKIDWTYRNDEYQRLVEIYSQHAANEYYDNPLDHLKIKDKAPGHYVRDALAMGHRMGILASSDGHFGYPGNGWMGGATALDSTSRGTGYVGIYAEKLTRQSLFDALTSRRVFATTDDRTILEFSVNGNMMGSEIVSEELPLIEGAVYSHTPIKQVEIVKFDGKNYTFESVPVITGESQVEFSMIDSQFVRDSFYYLRVVSRGNANDRYAWTSPVWVDKSIGNEISELPSSAVKGQLPGAALNNKTELLYSFSVNKPPYTTGGTISLEAYDINDSLEVSMYVNGIYVKSLDQTEPNSWSNTQRIAIPRYLVNSKNIIRFENEKNLLDKEISDWGVRNVRFTPGSNSIDIR